jgi:hypothetical protein
MKITRRRLVEGAGATALAALGLDRVVERLGGATPSAAAARPEQHVLDRRPVVVDEGVEVVVPPLHHRVVTARVKVSPSELRHARKEFEHALAAFERDGGPAVTVAWGAPYFRRLVPAQARREIPIDRRASGVRHRTVSVLEDAERFPSDPPDALLEQNDVAILLRGDDRQALVHAQQRLTGELPDLFAPTSVRTGMIGGGFGGRTSLPKRAATAARVRGGSLIPATAELFLGFTSTVRRAVGPPGIANFETLGYNDLRGGYFAGGTHMHLSHLYENLLAWYLDFDHNERAAAMFRPGIEVAAGRQTVRQSAADVETAVDVQRGYERFHRIGHAGAIQSASRLERDVVAPDGTLYRKGTAVPIRADFNTLDNPFAWTAHPERDRFDPRAQPGVHFVVFNPSSDDFRRVRLAMDGVLPNGVRLDLPPRSIGQGVNSVLRTTHRQNFLVPPRAHRSFPLSELRA